MRWTPVVNRVLARTTGLEVVRAGATAADADGSDARTRRPPVDRSPVELVRPPALPEVDRLLDRPVFVMSPVRSGSTLLRALLNEHSMLHAPHELHVRRLRVRPTTAMAASAMELLGHNEADLEHLLWDRVLHREVVRSGKRRIVDKTPSNAFTWKRISACWPDAQYLFLLRHPAAIAASWARAKPQLTAEQATEDALLYMQATSRARNNLDGLTVRYEDLTADPEAVTRGICDHLGVPWESGMLSYDGAADFVRGLGDWSENIRSGAVQPAREVPDDVPPRLRGITRRWGYAAPAGRDAAGDADDDTGDDAGELELADRADSAADEA